MRREKIKSTVIKVPAVLPEISGWRLKTLLNGRQPGTGFPSYIKVQ